MPNHIPSTRISIQEAMTRNAAARDIVTGLAAATPILAEIWQHLERALADVPDLAAELTQLAAQLADTRLDRANLLAAMHAALAAHADGEPDPLSYLRDELEASHRPSRTRRGQP
jgi:hypothetical protein